MSDASKPKWNVSAEILLALGRLEGRVEGIHLQLASGSKRMDEQDKAIENANDRVTAVEKRQSYWAGGLALFVFIVGLAGTLLSIYYGH